MRHKVIEMFGARVDWLLDAEAPSSTIEAILNTFGRSASTVDVLMLMYPYTARERVARDLLDTKNKLLPPVAPAYIGRQRSKRITDFDTLCAHFGGTLPKYELERINRFGDGLREIIYDHLDAPSDNYMQSRLRLFLEFMFGYVSYPHAFDVTITPKSRESGVMQIGWAKIVLYADPAGPNFPLYDGPL